MTFPNLSNHEVLKTRDDEISYKQPIINRKAQNVKSVNADLQHYILVLAR